MPPAAPLPCPCFPPAVPCLPCSLPIPSRQGRHGSLPRLPRIGIGSPVVLHGATNPSARGAAALRATGNRAPILPAANNASAPSYGLFSFILKASRQGLDASASLGLSVLNPQEAA